MSNSAKLSARERIESLVDANSFVEIGGMITKRNTDFNMQEKAVPADGVVTGYGVVNSNLVYIYSQDVTALNGSVGEMHAKKIAGIYEMAMKAGAPVIGLIDCAGIRVQEAMDALAGFGDIYMAKVNASGVIPQISAVLGSCGVGVDDVQSQHFRGLDDVAVSQRLKGRAAREGQVLVIELEAVGQGQERADGDRRHEVRDCDVPERFPAGRTVDLCGLEHILGDGLQAGDINNHHISDLLPAHEDDETPEAVFGFQHDGCVEVAEDAVEDHEPDIAQNDAADEVRHEEHGTEDVRALDALGQNIRDGKGQHVDDEQGHKREQRRIPERMEEALILEDGLVVFQSHPRPLAGRLELAEGQEQPLCNRVHQKVIVRTTAREQGGCGK